MAWTEDRVETLSKLWAEGLSASQIAKQLGGVTRNAVIGKVHRLGLSGRAKPSRPKPAKTAATSRASAPPKTKRTASAKPLKDGSYATILTLTEHMCKWPIGDPSSDEFRFCGRKTEPDEPYCKAHSMVAYQPSRRRNSSGKMISVGPAPTSRKRIR
jgi:GcrA cell cycle regulator